MIAAQAGLKKPSRRAGVCIALAAWFSAGAAQPAAEPAAEKRMSSGAEVQASPELLGEYERRLFPPPGCAAEQRCSQAQRAAISVVGGEIRLLLEIHAVSRSVYPLPSLGGAQWSSFGSEPRFLRSPAGGVGLLVEEGVSRVQLGMEPAGADVVLSFANAPKSLSVQAPGWSVEAPEQGAVSTIKMRRDTPAGQAGRGCEGERGAGLAQGAQFDAQLFIDERRVARFDASGADVTTTLRRLSPAAKPASATLELMPGEKLVSEGGGNNEGTGARVDFGAGVEEVEVRTRLEYQTSMAWVAHARADRRETWIIEPWGRAPLRFEGLAPVNAGGNGASVVFMPKPGERLSMRPQQITPVSGAQIAVDRSELAQATGEDKVEHAWTFLARSTIAAPLAFTVPPSWRVDSAAINGRVAGLSKKGAGYVVDLAPGSNSVSIKFSQDREAWWWTPAPGISLGAPVANLNWTLVVPQNQWVVWTAGPLVGPAVLIWGVLAAMCALACVLSKKMKAPFAPSFVGWVGILAPLSAISPWSGLVLVAFVFAMGAKESNYRLIKPRDWNGAQLGLMLLAAGSAVVLLAGVYQGLLGAPDMMVRGGGSSAGRLVWYLDKSEASNGSAQGLSAGALLAPIWLWRAVMLSWALWIASAVAKRLPSLWAALCLGGLWRRGNP